MGKTKNFLNEYYEEEYSQDLLFLQEEQFLLEQELLQELPPPEKIGKRIFSWKFKKKHKFNNRELPF